jgi:hypothetical protein
MYFIKRITNHLYKNNFSMVYTPYLTEAGYGGEAIARAVAARARELDVASDVGTRGRRVARNTIRATIYKGARRAEDLNLAEHTRGGCQGLAHITERARAGGRNKGRNYRTRSGQCGNTLAKAGGIRRAIVHVERGTAIGNGDVIPSIRGNLLQASLEGRHSSIPCPEKKIMLECTILQTFNMLTFQPCQP